MNTVDKPASEPAREYKLVITDLEISVFDKSEFGDISEDDITDEEVVHVIEYSAYKNVCKALAWHVNGEKKMLYECERKALAYREERDALLKKVGRLSAALKDIARRTEENK